MSSCLVSFCFLREPLGSISRVAATLRQLRFELWWCSRLPFVTLLRFANNEFLFRSVIPSRFMVRPKVLPHAFHAFLFKVFFDRYVFNLGSNLGKRKTGPIGFDLHLRYSFFPFALDLGWPLIVLICFGFSLSFFSLYVYMCVCTYVYMCTCIHAYMCIRVYVYMCICAYVHMCIRAYVHMCICVHVCMCACVHVCMCGSHRRMPRNVRRAQSPACREGPACVHVRMCACVLMNVHVRT